MRWLAALGLLVPCFISQMRTGSAQSLSAAPGIKYTTQWVAGETRTEETDFLRGDRSRTEYRNTFHPLHGDGSTDARPAPREAMIVRCDLGQAFELNLEDAEYVVSDFPQFKGLPSQATARTAIIPQKVAPWTPTVREERRTLDTGERKNFFGHEARHLIMTEKTIPLAGSRFESEQHITDGWYIDLDSSITCARRWPLTDEKPRHEYFAAGGERYEVIDDGIRLTGFAIERTNKRRTNIFLSDGTRREITETFEEKITDFYEGPLDPALFEVPLDFRKVSEVRREPPMTLRDRWYFTEGWLKGLAKSVFE